MCTESTREALGLPRDVSQSVSGYAKLERSLMSGLPNEVDFALNVFLLLSSEGRYILRGMKGMHVVDCMLACVGIGTYGELLLIHFSLLCRVWNLLSLILLVDNVQTAVGCRLQCMVINTSMESLCLMYVYYFAHWRLAKYCIKCVCVWASSVSKTASRLHKIFCTYYLWPWLPVFV